MNSSTQGGDEWGNYYGNLWSCNTNILSFNTSTPGIQCMAQQNVFKLSDLKHTDPVGILVIGVC